MLENEEPWRPPTQEKPSEVFRISPHVPELTIIGVDNKQTSKNNNFLQRAIGSQNKFTKSSIIANKSPIETYRKPQQQAFPSPPNFRQNIASSSSSNQFKNGPQVPDVTILDDKSSGNITETPPSRRSNDRVFTESYKEMLVNSHEQFLKQFNGPSPPNKPTTSATMSDKSSDRRRSPFFASSTITGPTQYKQNPLAKYVPRCDQIVSSREKDANTSSILIDISKINNEKTSPLKKLTEENDEVTFKKVAEMLSEIQKLVIPGSPQANEAAAAAATVSKRRSDSSNIDELNNAHDALRQLANTYLHPEELTKYQIESELNELATRNQQV